MIKPTPKTCTKCHHYVSENCYKQCDHIKSEYAKLEDENEMLRKFLNRIISVCEDPDDMSAGCCISTIESFSKQAIQNSNK
jgi:hypothetical protein